MLQPRHLKKLPGAEELTGLLVLFLQLGNEAHGERLVSATVST